VAVGVSVGVGVGSGVAVGEAAGVPVGAGLHAPTSAMAVNRTRDLVRSFIQLSPGIAANLEISVARVYPKYCYAQLTQFHLSLSVIVRFYHISSLKSS
jgi:hypothetical protein